MTNRRRRDEAGAAALGEPVTAVAAEPGACSGLWRGLVELLAAVNASRHPPAPAHSESCWSHFVRTFLNCTHKRQPQHYSDYEQTNKQTNK